MATVQLKCPETGKSIEMGDLAPDAAIATYAGVRPVPCPHCGKDHPWSTNHLGLAMQALQGSPEASRILVDGESATALA
jgi:hypothetical protein